LLGARSKSVSLYGIALATGVCPKKPLLPFSKGGNRKSPFVKGDLEGFAFA
jgi:hypothetical protein